MDAAVGPVQVPGLAVADVGIQLQRPVLGEHPNRVDTGVDAVGQGKVDDAILSSKGDRGFCHVAGEGVETAALSARQQLSLIHIFAEAHVELVDDRAQLRIVDIVLIGLVALLDVYKRQASASAFSFCRIMAEISWGV